MNWALSYANFKMRKKDKIFYLGYPEIDINSIEQNQAEIYLINHGIKQDKFNCCYLGVISVKVDLQPIIQTAKNLVRREINDINFIFCGDGPHYEYYRKISKDLDNIFFLGWVDLYVVRKVMEWSKIALVPFSVTDHSMSLPNKIFEYFFGGLPLISSLQGEAQKLLTKYKCGLYYQGNDEKAFYNALMMLYKNSDELKRMSVNAKNLYKNHFSSDYIYSNMIKYLEVIVRKYYKDKNLI
jgi:glycosyltransferase involved in cell wall biosynthesis